MNDSTTIYISHSDDMSNLQDLSSTTTSALSKKVAQNRAAQKAFRKRKQNYVEDLENKVKQLDDWKKAMIQLQADNDYLRKTVTRLKEQLDQYDSAAGSTLLPPTIPSPNRLPHEINAIITSSSAPMQPSSSSSPSDLSLGPNDTKHKPPTLSKREKKRQRLLADAKLYKNDDLEPIQLQCPLSMHNINSPPIEIKTEEEPPSLVVDTSLVQPFFDLPMTLDPHDHYINFGGDDDDDDDDFPSSSSSSSCSFSPYPPSLLF
ncbi:hypothetical protein BC941DRAFT_467154 [Chlamydoabsidia padenii]|nr:hypothetical protein BC941DRAFT_467154 [Chlamydoabsidia padenii]